MLHRLNAEMRMMLGHLTLVAGGGADALEIASQRSMEVNGPALAFVVRPALELAGQIVWLLADDVDPEDRSRRYFVWILADLRAKRLLLRDFRADEDMINRAVHDLDAIEVDLLADIRAAKWAARPTKYTDGGVEASVLLRPDGKAERMPRLESLVREVSSTPATYGLLSVTSHSQRFGVFEGLEVVGDSQNEQHDARLSGFPIKPNLLIGLLVLALNLPARFLGGWNGLDTAEVQAFSLQLSRKAGLL